MITHCASDRGWSLLTALCHSIVMVKLIPPFWHFTKLHFISLLIVRWTVAWFSVSGSETPVEVMAGIPVLIYKNRVRVKLYCHINLGLVG